jgi:hypothetical protein
MSQIWPTTAGPRHVIAIRLVVVDMLDNYCSGVLTKEALRFKAVAVKFGMLARSRKCPSQWQCDSF